MNRIVIGVCIQFLIMVTSTRASLVLTLDQPTQTGSPGFVVKCKGITNTGPETLELIRVDFSPDVVPPPLKRGFPSSFYFSSNLRLDRSTRLRYLPSRSMQSRRSRKFLIQLSRSRPCGSGAAQQRHRSTSDHRSRALLSNLDGLGLARSARYRSMAVSAPHAGIGTAKMLTGLSLLLFSGVINTNIAPVFADVFIGGAGPYRFLVDTASQTSLIDDVLANQLKLNPTYRVEIVTQKSTRLSPAAK